MTNTEEKYYNSLNNIQLVEKLIAQCDFVSNQHKMRESCQFPSESWDFYNKQYYDAHSLLIDIKYMIIRRMGGCTAGGKVDEEDESKSL